MGYGQDQRFFGQQAPRAVTPGYGYNGAYQGAQFNKRTEDYNYGPRQTSPAFSSKYTIARTVDSFDPNVMQVIQSLKQERLDKSRYLNLTLINMNDYLIEQLRMTGLDWEYVADFSIDASSLSQKGMRDLHRIISKVPNERFVGNPAFNVILSRSNPNTQLNQELYTHIHTKRQLQQNKTKLIREGVVAGGLLLSALIVGAVFETFVGFVITMMLAGFAIKYTIDFFSALKKQNNMNSTLSNIEDSLDREQFETSPPPIYPQNGYTQQGTYIPAIVPAEKLQPVKAQTSSNYYGLFDLDVYNGTPICSSEPTYAAPKAASAPPMNPEYSVQMDDQAYSYQRTTSGY